MDCHTMCGHVEGMLDRDQRTAKLRCDSNKYCVILSVYDRKNSYIHSYGQDSLNESLNNYRLHFHKRNCLRWSKSNRKNCYFWNAIRRLKQVLIAGIYLLSVISVPSTLSAPTKQPSAMSNRYDSVPKWILSNCSETNSATQLSDPEITETLLFQTTTAHKNAVDFRAQFSLKYFDVPASKLIEDWQNAHYENWLPNNEEITKIINRTIDPNEHLNSLTLPQVLIDIYRSLQIVAVGLEQITWDQQDDGAPFVTEFNQSQFSLRLVLSEMQTVIYESGYCNQMHPDIQRDWMPETLRKPENDIDKKMRDWIIYRDYINLLEYVMIVLDYFKLKAN